LGPARPWAATSAGVPCASTTSGWRCSTAARSALAVATVGNRASSEGHTSVWAYLARARQRPVGVAAGARGISTTFTPACPSASIRRSRVGSASHGSEHSVTSCPCSAKTDSSAQWVSGPPPCQGFGKPAKTVAMRTGRDSRLAPHRGGGGHSVSALARARSQLAKHAPRLEAAAVRANWRRRNRRRSIRSKAAAPRARPLLDGLLRDGVVSGPFEELFGNRVLFDEAAAAAARLRQAPRRNEPSRAGSKSSYLTKLAARSFEVGDPFVKVALHPNVLEVVNGYLRMRSTLRALELWLTHPTPDEPVQTQLWHRDADDVMNVKLFVYFTDVTDGAGPFTYAPGTHPLGDRRVSPQHDDHRRSTDEQMARVLSPAGWRALSGEPGTIVFADTCGYHKQRKPESEERVTLVAQYVSGRPYVPSALDLRGVDPSNLTEDQHYAVFDRPRS
jgi:hypothetical protein